jgi:Methyltransferase domain
MSELLIGCGRMRDRRISTPASIARGTEWEHLVTLDHNTDVNPDVVFDLSEIGVIKHVRTSCGLTADYDAPLEEKPLQLPWDDNTFEEVHAYEVLEHIGQQGDYRTFFSQFGELWRILKPGGLLCATVPSWKGMWAWGDPSHTRIINPGSLVFLSQKEYENQQGKTSMTDFRYLWDKDFDIVMQEIGDEQFAFVLQAVKS